jgi:hypothetical protein
MVHRNNKVDCYFCFHKDIYIDFSYTVSEPEIDSQRDLLPSPFSKVCKVLKTVLLRVDVLQTRILVTPHSFEVLILAEKIIILFDSMTKCSVFRSLIQFLCGKRKVNGLRTRYSDYFLSFRFPVFWYVTPSIYQIYVNLVGIFEELFRSV